MITALLILIINMVDMLVFKWWLEPLIDAIEELLIKMDQINSWAMIGLQAFSYITFFIPVSHLVLFTSVFAILTIIKTIMAIYNQAAQVIP